MRQKWLFAAAAFTLFFTLSCDDIQTGYSYDRSADFSGLETYAWVGRKDPETSAVIHQRIISNIRLQLTAKGLRSSDLNPDVYITYFADHDEQVRVDIRHRGYTYGSGWYSAGGQSLILGGSTSEIRTFSEGSIVVDIYRSKGNQLIWRGVATGTLSEDPKKKEDTIKKAVKKVFKFYPPPNKG